MTDTALKPAIRKALRLHEIGSDSPYQISFAAKGKSGASFGFMQGDLAAHQREAVTTFRAALAAAGIAAARIDDFVQRLSVHLMSNPLTASETAEVNAALRASARLVDQMDEQILGEVYGHLDRCIAAASGAGRRIEPKAQVYIALWVNMSGPPTSLLRWLQGDDPELSRHVAPAGAVVDGAAMEDYLAATSYYVQNPRNMIHLRNCAAAGMREIRHPVESAFAGAMAEAAPRQPVVTIHARAPDGRDFIVSLEKTGPATGLFKLREDSAGAGTSAYEVELIKVAADGSKLNCRNKGVSAAIACALFAGADGEACSVQISITGTPFGLLDSTTTYSVARGDHDSLKAFIANSGFPKIASPQPPAAFTAAAPAALESMSVGDVYDAAIKAVELWNLHQSSEDYDTHVDALVKTAAAQVKLAPTAGEIARWLQLQSSALGISDEEITETTLSLRDVAQTEFESALAHLPASQRLRIRISLGDVDPDPGPGASATMRFEEALSSASGATNVFGFFTGQRLFQSVRGFPVVGGQFRLIDRAGTDVGTYHVNSGGGARGFRTTNGPIPPGVYRVSGFRNRATVGMVLNGIGYSFNLDPVFGTPVFGRSLFRIHPDGGSEQTNGCLGVRESANNLARCRDQLNRLIAEGPVNVSVSYDGLSI